MQKSPLISIDEGPLDVWYESPSVMVVKKPRDIKVFPSEKVESGTLLNRLFQHNRWLAQMETKINAGVLHIYEQHDHGLMLFNKNDEYEVVLENALEENEIEFSYIIHVKGDQQLNVQALKDLKDFNIQVHSQKRIAEFTMIDLMATSGNTQELRHTLFSNIRGADTTFYCYQISLVLPHSGEKQTVTLRDTSKPIPNISVYHAPP